MYAGMYLVFSFNDELTGVLLIFFGIIVVLAVLGVYTAYAASLKTPGAKQ